MLFKIIFFYFAMLPVNLAIDWCSIKCEIGKKTEKSIMCTHKIKSHTDTCFHITDSRTFDRRMDLLTAHNNYRNRVAGGEVEGHKKVANMMEMYWDSLLEEVAQRLAYQCIGEYDGCFNTPDFNRTIQFGQDSTLGNKVDKGLRYWISNNVTDDPLVFDALTKPNNDAIGCGEIKYLQNGLFKNTIICNYHSTTENFIFGEPCTKCPPGARCKREPYRNLCSYY